MIHSPTNFKLRTTAQNADDRQAIVLAGIGVPFLAATLPATAAGLIGIYGVYGDQIRNIYNSIFGKVYLYYNAIPILIFINIFFFLN